MANIAHYDDRAGMANGGYLPERASSSGHANDMVVTMPLGGPAWEWGQLEK
jgi:hypothetical protein